MLGVYVFSGMLVLIQKWTKTNTFLKKKQKQQQQKPGAGPGAGRALENTGCSSRGPRFSSSTHKAGLRTMVVTSVPSDTMSSILQWHQAGTHTVDIYEC